MTRLELKFLLSQQEYPSVSITVALSSTMPDRAQNVTKVKTAIAAAKEQLLQEFTQEECKPVLDKLYAAEQGLDYEHMSAQGVAIFANKQVVQTYLFPVSVADRVVIDSSFEVREVILALSRTPKYWVLVLSEKPSRLFYGIGDVLTEIIEPAKDALGQDQDGFPYTFLPSNIDKKSDLHDSSGQQFRGSVGHTGDGHVKQSLGNDARHLDEQKLKFVERVFKLADRFLKVEPLPLIIVCENKNHAFFEKASHGYQVAGWLRGDYCKRNAHGLAEAVKPLIQEYFEKQCTEKITEFEEEAMGTNKHAFGINAVWRAAQEGRVRELLVEESFVVTGIVDPDNKFHIIVTEQQKKPAVVVDLVNDLIEVVLSKGDDARVVFCKPGSLKKYESIAAILRY